MTSIEITIPVLDEEDTLAVQVRKTCAYIAEHLADLAPITLVIADNGSKDKTPEIAAALAADPALPVRYLRLEKRGVGLALKASWGGSDADIVGYMDLDLATDLKYLRPALAALLADTADAVTGSRLAPGSRVIGRSLKRAITSRAFNLIVKLMFANRFSDGMCGFKFLKRRHLQRIRDAGAVSDGWIFATEVLLVAERLGLRVLDLPVTWTDDPNSKVKIGKLANEYIAALRVLRARLATLQPA